MDDFAGPLVLGYNVIEDVAYLIKIDIIMGQESLGCLSVTENGGDWVG